MNTDGASSDEIFDWLVYRGLEEPAAILLDIARPLMPLGAQAVYLVEPLIGSRGGLMRELARLLEDEEEVQALAERLRQEIGS